MIGQFWTPSNMIKRLDLPSLGSIHQLENVTVPPCLWKTKYGWYSATSAMVKQTLTFSTSLMIVELVGVFFPPIWKIYAKVKLDHEIPKELGVKTCPAANPELWTLLAAPPCHEGRFLNLPKHPGVKQGRSSRAIWLPATCWSCRCDGQPWSLDNSVTK